MNRRKLLLASGVTLSTALAGCSSDETDDENGNESENEAENGSADAEVPEQPEISTEDVDPDDAATSLTISWNATVFDAMSRTDDEGQYISDDGERYLVLAKRIENTGDEETSFATGELVVTAGREEADWTAIGNASGVNEDVPPGESAEGLSAFEIAEEAEAVSITASPLLGSYAATFEYDDSLGIPFESIEEGN